MKITASVSHGSLTATFNLPDDCTLITWEQIVKELKKESYKHCLTQFPGDDSSKANVFLDTVSQFSTFVSWLAETIAQNW